MRRKVTCTFTRWAGSCDPVMLSCRYHLLSHKKTRARKVRVFFNKGHNEPYQSMLNVGPNLARHRIGETRQNGQEDQNLHTHGAALFQFRFSRPIQEG